MRTTLTKLSKQILRFMCERYYEVGNKESFVYSEITDKFNEYPTEMIEQAVLLLRSEDKVRITFYDDTKIGFVSLRYKAISEYDNRYKNAFKKLFQIFKDMK